MKLDQSNAKNQESLQQKAKQIWDEKHPNGRIVAVADPSADQGNACGSCPNKIDGVCCGEVR